MSDYETVSAEVTKHGICRVELSVTGVDRLVITFFRSDEGELIGLLDDNVSELTPELTVLLQQANSVGHVIFVKLAEQNSLQFFTALHDDYIVT